MQSNHHGMIYSSFIAKQFHFKRLQQSPALTQRWKLHLRQPSTYFPFSGIFQLKVQYFRNAIIGVELPMIIEYKVATRPIDGSKGP